jgi:hypothetical protein
VMLSRPYNTSNIFERMWVYCCHWFENFQM